MENKSNPPAFPQNKWSWEENENADVLGMTLRDYFAAKAMQGIMVGDNPASHYGETVAQWAYGIADAMINQRDNVKINPASREAVEDAFIAGFKITTPEFNWWKANSKVMETFREIKENYLKGKFD